MFNLMSVAKVIRILSLIFFACFGGLSIRSPAAQIPAHVRKSLDQNAARLSPIIMRWKYQLVERDIRSYLSSVMLEKINPDAYVEQQVDCKIKGGRYFFHREFSQYVRDSKGNIVGDLKRLVEEKSCDGQRTYMYSATTKGKQPWSVSINPKNNRSVLRDNFLEKAGFRMSNLGKDNEVTGLVPEVLVMLNDGKRLIAVENTQLDGRPCLRVEFDSVSSLSTEPRQRHEFYLDQETAYTLRRRDVKRPDGTMLVRVELSDIQRIGGGDGPWLPRRCRVLYYQYQGLPKTPAKDVVMEDDYYVESCSLADIPDSAFVLNYLRPGMHVGDATLPGAEKTKHGFIDYVVPANPADLDRVIKRSLSQQAPVVRGWTLSRSILLGVNVLLFVILSLILVWRRRRRSRTLVG